MKIVFYDEFKPGLLTDRGVVDVSSTLKDVDTSTPQNTLKSIIQNFDRKRGELESAAKSGKALPVNGVRLRQPVPRPQVMICAVGNYGEGVGKQPVADFFLKSPYSIVGNGDTVVLPARPETQIFHHEAELAFVIGKAGEYVKEADAMEHVFGYTAFMDISARGLSNTFFKHKSFHTFGPLGPCLVTKDEIPDPHNLSVKMWVNGQARHDYNTSDMYNKIPTLIKEATSITRVEPGDMIACGTNHQGIGPVQDGEEVTLQIEKVGKLTVHVSDPLKRKWPFEIDAAMAKRVRESGQQRPQAQAQQPQAQTQRQ